MSSVVTHEMIDRLRARGIGVLERELFGAGEPSRGTQALGSGFLAEQIVWQVLVPLLVTITGGLVVELVKGTFEKPTPPRPTIPAAPHDLAPLVNRPIRTITRVQVRECVLAVHEVLEPYGADPPQSGRIVAELLNAAGIEVSGEVDTGQHDPQRD